MSFTLKYQSTFFRVCLQVLSETYKSDSAHVTWEAGVRVRRIHLHSVRDAATAQCCCCCCCLNLNPTAWRLSTRLILHRNQPRVRFYTNILFQCQIIANQTNPSLIRPCVMVTHNTQFSESQFALWLFIHHGGKRSRLLRIYLYPFFLSHPDFL